jgi:hypothetical protein
VSGTFKDAKPPSPDRRARYDSRPDTYAHIDQVRALLLGCVGDLLHRAHVHDRSKLRDPERAVFDEYSPKLANTTYGSEEYQRYLEEMGKALDHHYRENDHHPEYHPNGIHDMDLLQLIEMLCDWIAATRRHNDGNIILSIEKNAERFGYGEEITQLLLNSVGRIQAREA